MFTKIVIASIARRLCLAGFSLLLIARGGVAPGGEPASLKEATLRGLDGKPIPVAAPAGGASVLFFYSTECPISNAYSPTFHELMARFANRPVKWVGICVDPDLSDDEVRAHARDFKLNFPVARDRRGTFARKIGATKTPEAFLVDSGGKVRYHGRIDDQFVSRRVRNATPSGSELKDAIAAVLDGKEVAVPHVEAVGCPIPEAPGRSDLHQGRGARCSRRTAWNATARVRSPRSPSRPTQQARKRAADIASVVEERSMPPWKAAPHFGVKFKDERTLPEKDVATLVGLVRSRGPRGRPARPAAVPPSSPMTGRSASPTWSSTSAPTSRSRPRATTSIDASSCRPASRRISTSRRSSTGSAIAGSSTTSWRMSTSRARRGSATRPIPARATRASPGRASRSPATWAAGRPASSPARCPKASAGSLPRGGDIIIQMHYHPSGKAETDRTRIGLHFARKPIRQTLHWAAALNPELELPPGGSNIEVKAAWPVPVDLVAHAVTPHMHLLGRDIAMSITYPRRPRPGPDQDRRLGLQLAVFLLLREAPGPAQGLRPERRLALRQHVVQPEEPQQAAQARQVGRGHHRRDVRRLHRGDQERAGPDAAGREGRPQEIFHKQREEYRAKREQAIREAQEKDARNARRPRAVGEVLDRRSLDRDASAESDAILRPPAPAIRALTSSTG